MAEEDELQSLPAFVACHVRCLTAREENYEAEEAVEVDEDEGTVTVTHPPDVHRNVKRQTVLLENLDERGKREHLVFDEALLEEGDERDNGYQQELWEELQEPLLDRLELARETCVMVLGTQQSGKSRLLFGGGGCDRPEDAEEEVGAAGLLWRFGRYAFDQGFSDKGGVEAIEVSMVAVAGNEHLFDLLDPPAEPSTLAGKHKLRLRFSAAMGTFVQNVSHSIASDMSDFMTILHEVRVTGRQAGGRSGWVGGLLLPCRVSPSLIFFPFFFHLLFFRRNVV